MLRRTKSDSQIGLNIPPKKETVFSVPLTELQLGWYRKILTGVDESILLGSVEQGQSQSSVAPIAQGIVQLTTDAWETDGAADSKTRSHITTNTLMELRKCSIHPYLLTDAFPEERRVGQHIVDASGKFIVLQKMIRQFVVMENKKVIIFSGFDQTLNLCEDLLEVEKAHFPFRHARLDGSTSSAWRNLSVFLFQNDPRYKVFLLSTRAGGEGLNLVSSSTVVFLDDDWNPQVMRQAESRVHRIGQTQPVQIFRIHAKGTVEDQMRRRLNKKAYLADKVMGDFGNDISYPIDLGESTEEEISLMPGRSIVSRSFDAKDLANSDFHSIMSSCALDEVSVQDMSLAEKKAWLGRAERVKTDIFNGVKVETKSRRFSVYEETAIGVSKASRRIGKSRVVTVGEWNVSKESMEMARPVSLTFPKQVVEDRVHKVNEATCFLCRGQRPIECETCTRSFHVRCLDAEDMDYASKGQSIICPHHYCCTCGKTASDAQRLLFNCLKCPRAYCENCLDWGRTNFVGGNPTAEALGYVPRNAFFIECVGCGVSAAASASTSAGKRPLEFETMQLDLDSPKRAKRC
ncbi:P-loop containing nucleoside triphosphate hydrolase protein [Aspergillus fruticulosus]